MSPIGSMSAAPATIVYVAEGLAGYDDALRLALRSVVADRVVPGEIRIATTGAGDPVAFARVQAGALDRQRAFAEAYRRNNAGSFAESAEFFAVLTEGQSEAAARAEALVNQALQKSNLGRYGEAETLFAEAADDGRRRSGRGAALPQLSRHASAQSGLGGRGVWPSWIGPCRDRRRRPASPKA